MNDPMTILRADHREVKSMLKTLAESEQGTERDALCRKVTDALTLHMRIEEELVYPLILEHIGEEEDEEAVTEHGLAREALTKLNSMTAKPGFGAVVEMLAGGINHHVEEEEAELLPELKSELDRAEWLELGDKIAAAKDAAGAPKSPTRKRRTAATSSDSRR